MNSGFLALESLQKRPNSNFVLTRDTVDSGPTLEKGFSGTGGRRGRYAGPACCLGCTSTHPSH